MKVLQDECNKINIKAVVCKHWSKGGEGTIDLANEVIKLADQENSFKCLYDDKITLFDKIKTIAKEIYNANDVIVDNKIWNQFFQKWQSNWTINHNEYNKEFISTIKTTL